MGALGRGRESEEGGKRKEGRGGDRRGRKGRAIPPNENPGYCLEAEGQRSRSSTTKTH